MNQVLLRISSWEGSSTFHTPHSLHIATVACGYVGSTNHCLTQFERVLHYEFGRILLAKAFLSVILFINYVPWDGAVLEILMDHKL